MKTFNCHNILLFCVSVLIIKGTNGIPIGNISNFPHSKFTLQQPCPTPSPTQPLIVGGEEAIKHEFPWIVNIIINDHLLLCGGTLIELDLILTAASCIHDIILGFGTGWYNITDLWVGAGDHNMNLVGAGCVIGTPISATLHPHYSKEQGLNDIAVMKLDKPYFQDETIRPISLPKSDRTKDDGKNATIAGWGGLRYGGYMEYLLQKAQIPLVTGSRCNNQLTELNGSQFCAGGKGIQPCQGDFGGPVLCEAAPEELCGIITRKTTCGCENTPAVYTNVFFHRDWIEEQLGTGSGSERVHVAFPTLLTMSFVFKMLTSL